MTSPSRPGIRVSIPNGPSLDLRHLVLDLNGTLALDGGLLEGVPEALADLCSALDVRIITADTFGTAAALADLPGLTVVRLPPGAAGGEAKAEAVRSLGAGHTAAMGNGVNDVPMLKAAALAIAVLGPEGAAPAAMEAATVVVRHPLEGLDLLRNPLRLRATLRP
jgi:P-type E1-E2 ATPase